MQGVEASAMHVFGALNIATVIPRTFYRVQVCDEELQPRYQHQAKQTDMNMETENSSFSG